MGGGNLASDTASLTRLYLRLGAGQLQLAAEAPTPAAAAAALSAARDSFASAVGAGRSASEAGWPGATPGPWALGWLGLGRALWATAGREREAESALGEGNALDNGSCLVWGWLAYVCLCAEERVAGLSREREAAAALQQALKEVSGEG